MFNLLITISFSLIYSLIFIYVDIFYIKWYRNLLKKDKVYTLTFKSLFVLLTASYWFYYNLVLIGLLVLCLNLIFDSLAGLYFYKSIFKTGSNSKLDEFADNLDNKKDKYAKLFWYLRFFIILIYIILYLCLKL